VVSGRSGGKFSQAGEGGEVKAETVPLVCRNTGGKVGGGEGKFVGRGRSRSLCLPNERSRVQGGEKTKREAARQGNFVRTEALSHGRGRDFALRKCTSENSVSRAARGDDKGKTSGLDFRRLPDFPREKRN